MGLQVLTIESSESQAQLESIINLDQGAQAALQSYINYFTAINGGINRAIIDVDVGAVAATATLTSTGAASDGETGSIANVTITAKSSGAVENEFNVSATPATQAANIAACINESSDLAGIVTAEAVAGVVTITSVIPGAIGNGIQISESWSNISLVAFAGGADGDTLVIDCS